MFRGVSETCQNIFATIYFEAEDIFWKWFLDVQRDQNVTDHATPPPRGRGGGPEDRLTVTNLMRNYAARSANFGCVMRNMFWAQKAKIFLRKS